MNLCMYITQVVMNFIMHETDLATEQNRNLSISSYIKSVEQNFLMISFTCDDASDHEFSCDYLLNWYRLTDWLWLQVKISFKRPHICLINSFSDQLCKSLFDLMDLDKNGYISMDEFKNLIGLAGLDKNDPAIEILFQHLDLDKDKRLNYEGMVVLASCLLSKHILLICRDSPINNRRAYWLQI